MQKIIMTAGIIREQKLESMLLALPFLSKFSSDNKDSSHLGMFLAEESAHRFAGQHLAKMQEKARNLDIDAIASLNTFAPGAIYDEKRIVTELKKQTELATSGTSENQIQEALKWLRKATLPRQPRDRQIRKITLSDIGWFFNAYADVVAIRLGLRKIGKAKCAYIEQIVEAATELFPNLLQADNDIKNAACNTFQAGGKKVLKPVEAAAYAVGKTVGLEERSVRGRILDIPDWSEYRQELETLGKFIGTVAVVRLNRNQTYLDKTKVHLPMPMTAHGRHVAEEVLGYDLPRVAGHVLGHDTGVVVDGIAYYAASDKSRAERYFTTPSH
jgi:hypothetical protein